MLLSKEPRQRAVPLLALDMILALMIDRGKVPSDDEGQLMRPVGGAGIAARFWFKEQAFRLSGARTLGPFLLSGLSIEPLVWTKFAKRVSPILVGRHH
jgi:hypothetical protein